MASASETASDASRAFGAPESRYPFTPYPNGWFRVAACDDVANSELRSLHYFGRDLVLYRTKSGVAHVVDAYCPHLGAHLGHGGEVVGENIRCPFHHWEFDGEGRCAKVPYAKRVPPKANVRHYPIVEKNGIVLLWHHRDDAPPSFDVPELEELGHADWTPPDTMHWDVRAHWLDMNENCVDQAHFKYVHGTLTIPPTTAEMEGHIHRAKSSFTMRTPDGEAPALLVTTDHGPGFQTVHITGLIDTLMMNTATPIDEELTDVRFCYAVKSEGDVRNGHLANAVVKDLKQQFEHDRPIWENKIYHAHPMLCDGDGQIGHYRRWYQQFI